MGRRVTILGLSVAVVACHPFAADVLPSNDGGVRPTDAEVPALDGGVDADDGSLKPCARQPAPLMCDDFDSALALTNDWRLGLAGGGAVMKSDGDAISSPKVLEATISVVDVLSHAHILRALGPGLPDRVRVDFDVRLVSGPARGRLPINRLTIGSLAVHLTVSTEGDATLHTMVGDSAQDFPGVQLRLDVWKHVTISVDLSGGPARVGLAVNGTTILDGQPLTAPVDVTGQGELMMGVYYALAREGPWTVRFDNAVVTAW